MYHKIDLMNKPDISIILPCYNEGYSLEENAEKIVRELKKLKRSWELIFVEDKSTDQTKANVEKLVKKTRNSSAIFHSKNRGRGKSAADGILKAKGKICGFLDVDLEVAPHYIPLFIHEIENGADMVIGRRFYEGGFRSLARYLASKTYALVVKIFLKIPIEDTEAGYKFFTRSKILPILSKVQDKHWFWDTEICARAFWVGLEISEIPVLFIRKHEKRSTVKLIPDTWDYLIKVLKFRSQVPKLHSQQLD